MKEIIINILFFVLFFNLIVIIFPEGKTQKYCKLVIKLFLFIYILNSIVLKNAVSLDNLLDFSFQEEYENYEREMNLSETNTEFIEALNNEMYSGREVIENITVNFSENMKLSVYVKINDNLSSNDIEFLKTKIAKIFNTTAENIIITTF